MPTMRFTNDPICVAICREFVETALRTYPRAVIDRAVLVTSELVTNVILHTPGGGLLELDLATELLQVVVSDQSDEPPVELPHGESAFHGRGLPIVRSLADDWGIEHTGSGKSIWATFAAAAEGQHGLLGRGCIPLEQTGAP